jgi:hypothetical protein
LRDTFVDERDGPLPAMLLALTALAGIVDATSILALKHVFVATMTGNVVFIGLGLSGAPRFSVWARHWLSARPSSWPSASPGIGRHGPLAPGPLPLGTQVTPRLRR